MLLITTVPNSKDLPCPKLTYLNHKKDQCMFARSGQALDHFEGEDSAEVTGKNLAMGQQVKKMKQLIQNFFFHFFLHQMHHFCTNHPDLNYSL